MQEFRPKTFQDIIGQESAKDTLRSKALAFLKTESAVGHMLFLGPSGVGKTTLALVYANTIGVKLHEVMATTINTWKDFVPYLENLGENDILFVDEIHALKPKIQEILYYIMEDFKHVEKNRTMRLPRFTLIGATTHAGNLNEPLRRRFVTPVMLEYYSNKELAEIAKITAYKAYGIDNLSDEVADKLAQLSKRKAANVVNLVRQLVEICLATYGTNLKSDDITMHQLRLLLRQQRIDPLVGLDVASRRYLMALLTEGKPLGISSLSTLTNEQEDTVRNMIEPYLMGEVELPVQQKTTSGEYEKRIWKGPFVKATPRGRVATELAAKYIDMCRSAQKTSGWFANERLVVRENDYEVI